MRINKLLGALGNLDQIAEGIKNKIFKRDDVEAIAKVRWLECKVCPLLDVLKEIIVLLMEHNLVVLIVVVVYH